MTAEHAGTRNRGSGTGPIRYFAYGSNMNSRQMAERCPTARLHQVATLEHHSPLLNIRGVLTLRPSAGRNAHGVLWHLDTVDLERLDRFEGVDDGRYARVEKLVLLEGAISSAFVYIDPRLAVGPARPGYMERVLHGAREHGLPGDYIDQLRDMHDRSGSG